MKAGNNFSVSMKDHAPFAQAFSDVAQMTYLDLLDETSRYFDAFSCLDSVTRNSAPDDDAEESQCADDDADPDQSSLEDRYRNVALAAGFVLRTKAAGWKLFCQRMNASPWQLWEYLPGYERLQRALALSEKAAFVEEGFLRWFNEVAPAGEPVRTEVPFTVEGIAETTEEAYQMLVKWWNGGQLPV